ncbi:MAG: ABC transporter substrate-binding protein, partial [Dehalococcoidia bacterium]
MEVYCRAVNVLELLVHRVAEQAGLYQPAGVEVTVKDGSGAKWKEEHVLISFGLGDAVQSRLLRGTEWVIVCVNTQYPLFWLFGQPSVERLADLRGARVAGYPPGSAPGTF